MAIDAPLPALRPGPVRKLLKIATHEMWCRDCGADTPSVILGHGDYDIERTCLHCGSANLVPATSILLPDEYYIVS